MKECEVHQVGARIPVDDATLAKIEANLRSNGFNLKHFWANVAAPDLVMTPELEQSETKELFRFQPTDKEMSKHRKEFDKHMLCGDDWFFEHLGEMCKKYKLRLVSNFTTYVEDNQIVVCALL